MTQHERIASCRYFGRVYLRSTFFFFFSLCIFLTLLNSSNAFQLSSQLLTFSLSLFLPLNSSSTILFLQIFLLTCQAASGSDGSGSFSPLIPFQSPPALLLSKSNFCLKVFKKIMALCVPFAIR